MANSNLTDAEMCQMAIEHLSKRITIQFPEYPQFGSKFAAICAEEAYEELDSLIEDVAEGFAESIILETLADETEIKEHHKEALCSYIHYTLSTFSPPPTSLDLATISIKTTAKERYAIQEMLKKHAPCFKPHSAKDAILVQLFTIGRQHRFPLVTYLLDLYARYRLLEYQKLYDELNNIPQQKQRKRQRFINKGMYNVTTPSCFVNKCHVMKVLKQQSRTNNRSEKLLTLVAAFIPSIFRKIFPIPVRLVPVQIISKINDSLFVYANYYIALLIAVDKMLKDSRSKFPLQIDFWLIPNAMYQHSYDEPTLDWSEDSESSYASTDDDDYEPSYNLNDLEKRLEFTDNLVTKDITSTDVGRLSTILFDVCQRVVNGVRSKRMVIIVDRRDRDMQSKEALYAYLPKHTQNIPSGNYLHECMFHLSMVEVLPSGSGKLHELGELDPEIHVRSYLANMFLLSLHVHSEDTIRAYWYINGSYTRWFVNDIINIWPLYFVEEYDIYGAEREKCSQMLVCGSVQLWCNVSVPFDVIMVVQLFYGIMPKPKQNIGKTVELIKAKAAFNPLRDDSFDEFFKISTKIQATDAYAGNKIKMTTWSSI
eukprot:746944_1